MLFHANQFDTFGATLENIIEDALLLSSTVEGHVHVLPDARDVLLEDKPCGLFLCVYIIVCLYVFTFLCLLKGKSFHCFRRLEDEHHCLFIWLLSCAYKKG